MGGGLPLSCWRLTHQRSQTLQAQVAARGAGGAEQLRAHGAGAGPRAGAAGRAVACEGITLCGAEVFQLWW